MLVQSPPLSLLLVDAMAAARLAQAGTESHKHDIGYWVERGKRLDYASGARYVSDRGAGGRAVLPEITDASSCHVASVGTIASSAESPGAAATTRVAKGKLPKRSRRVTLE